jgi:RHS repeat-associated protein
LEGLGTRGKGIEQVALPAPSPRRSAPDTSVYPAVKFFVKDHLGNVRVAYSASINDTTCLVRHRVLAVMDYSPYGGILRSWFSSVPERWQSTGHERDLESGWDMRGARMYDAAYGRFLSRDPLAGAFPSWSPYNYVLGNPVRLTDLSGMGPDGIKGGGAPLADDGVPITYLSDVVITARCEYCYLNAVITTFGNGNYLGGQPTLSGVGVNAPHDLNEGDAAVGFDVIGTSEIPGLSTAADVGSGLLSVKNGDYLGGGISLAASIPAVGVLFNGAKWVRRMFKWGDKAAGVAKYGDEAGEVVGNGISFGSKTGGTATGITNVVNAPIPLAQFNSVESLLGSIPKFDKLKAGVKQAFINGDGPSILRSITNSAKSTPSGRFILPDGTNLGMHFSTRTGEYTIDINNLGKVFKIRINP